MSKDDCPWSLGVLLGQACNLLCNLLDVLGLVAVGLGECGSLGLVANEDVDVWKNLIKRVLEEL